MDGSVTLGMQIVVTRVTKRLHKTVPLQGMRLTVHHVSGNKTIELNRIFKTTGPNIIGKATKLQGLE